MANKKTKIKPLTGKFGDFSGIVLKAAARGDTAAVKYYLKRNPEWLNQEGPHGRTLLWEAAYKGRTETVRQLIKLGADVNPLGSYYTPMLVELSALAVARSAGRDELVYVLEAAGATDELYAASYRGDLEAIDSFLKVDPNAVEVPIRDEPPHPRMGYHAVHYAVVGRQLGALRLLVGYGATVRPHFPLLLEWAGDDRQIKTFLRTQAKKEPAPKVSMPAKKTDPKLKSVPAVDRPDWMGYPPLVDACRGNHNAPDDPSRVQKLLDRGADVNIKDYKEKTPLHRSSQAGFVKITTLLLKTGAQLEAVDSKGCTPIFDAAAHGRTKLVELLIRRGANWNHTESRGETPLFVAARGGHEETFDALLKAGSDLSHQNARGNTIADILAAKRQLTPERKRILQKASPAKTRKKAARKK